MSVYLSQGNENNSLKNIAKKERVSSIIAKKHRDSITDIIDFTIIEGRYKLSHQ